MGETKKIKYVNGNLFDRLVGPKSKVVVPHITNSKSVMGSGFAASVRELYPKTNEKYMERCNFYELATDFRPMTFFTPEDFGFFANMTCQTTFGPQRNANYSDLVDCMRDVVTFCNKQRIKELYCPKFGAGTCHLEWPFIEELIKDIWLDAGLNVTIFVLPEAK